MTRRSISSRQETKKPQHRIEVSAGGLVFKKTDRGIFVAMLQDSFGNWTFPKGHVRRRRESRQRAAEREIKEELGLSELKFVRPLGQIDIWFRDRFVFKGKMVHKFIHYFLFEAPVNAKLIVPEAKEKGEKIQAVAWVPLQNVVKQSSYRDMNPIIQKSLQLLRK
ncbi:NUDIX domain-containing protein [Patescibacteria group bacterium]|nr:NUDIX domain-containing protein [Patescibacteria group bacterium]